MRSSALLSALALALLACQTASADFVSFAAGSSTGNATPAVLVNSDINTQEHELSSSAFGNPNRSVATFDYSGMGGVGPGNGTFEWTITNTGATTVTQVNFDLTNFVGVPIQAVRFTGASAAGFTALRENKIVRFFGDLLPGASATFTVLARYADFPNVASGTFDLGATAIPEPSTMILLGLGAVAVGGWGARRKLKARAV
jgi:hypothetical protein